MKRADRLLGKAELSTLPNSKPLLHVSNINEREVKVLNLQDVYKRQGIHFGASL